MEQRTQAALGTLEPADPAWIRPAQKWFVKAEPHGLPLSSNLLLFPTLIYQRSRQGRISPSSCSLPQSPCLRVMRHISWPELSVCGTGKKGEGGNKFYDFKVCVCVLGGRSGSLDLCRYQNLCRDNLSQSISLAIMIPLHTFLWYSNIKVFEKLK